MTDEQSKKVPRDERELNAEIEIHTPSWLPGAKIAVGYKRLWDKRVEQFIEAAAETAGVRPDSLADVVEQNDAIQDVFVRAANRIKERSDEMYVDVLSRLVGAALVDETRVDEIGFVVDRLIRLDPVHVRIVSLFPYRSAREAVAAGNPLARRYSRTNADTWRQWERWEQDLVAAQEAIADLHSGRPGAKRWLRSNRVTEVRVQPDHVYQEWLRTCDITFIYPHAENGRLEGRAGETFFSLARADERSGAVDRGEYQIYPATYVKMLGISKPVLGALLGEIAAIDFVEQGVNKGWKITDLGKTAAYLLIDVLRARAT